MAISPASEVISATDFMPHGHCYFWQPEILWVHVISDALIAASYASIPAALIYFVYRRKDLEFSWVFVLFGVFILTCGATHIMNIYTTWVPLYFTAGLLKVVCAAASVGTAMVLWPLIPTLLRIPSPSAMESANLLLSNEIQEHKRARAELATQARALAEKAKELDEANIRLAESNRHLDEFTSVVAHDLQEPLRKIMTFGSMLQDKLGGTLDESSNEKLNRMISASDRMQILINNLLHYARITHRQTEYEQVDLGSVVTEVKENLSDLVRRNHGSIEVRSQLPTIDADPAHMTQLFQNLISNGLKFHRPDVDPAVTINVEAMADPKGLAGAGYRFSVADNGIGIAEENLDKIFNTFQRLHTRAEFEGTGIGLSVCKEAVERHGGELRVHSTVGQGSRFEFWLPAHQTEGDHKTFTA